MSYIYIYIYIYIYTHTHRERERERENMRFLKMHLDVGHGLLEEESHSVPSKLELQIAQADIS
jgi:hypothetical protein